MNTHVPNGQRTSAGGHRTASHFNKRDGNRAPKNSEPKRGLDNSNKDVFADLAREANSSVALRFFQGSSSEQPMTVGFSLKTLSPEEVATHVRISPFNPRHADEGAKDIMPLAKDIRKNGQIEPVWAHERDGKYYVLNGSRRTFATQYLGAPLVLLITKARLKDSQLKIIAESLANTKELSLVEKGAIFANMMAAKPDMKLDDIAAAKSVSRTLVSLALKAHFLPDYLKNPFNSPTSIGKPTILKLNEIHETVRAAKESENDNKPEDCKLSEAATLFQIEVSRINGDDIKVDFEERERAKLKKTHDRKVDKLRKAYETKVARIKKQAEENNTSLPTIRDFCPIKDAPAFSYEGISETKLNSLVLKKIVSTFNKSTLSNLLNQTQEEPNASNSESSDAITENDLDADVIDIRTSRIVAGHKFDGKVSTFSVKNLSKPAKDVMVDVHRGAVKSFTDARSKMSEEEKAVYKDFLKLIGNVEYGKDMTSKEKGRYANIFMNILQEARESENEEQVGKTDQIDKQMVQ